MNISNSERFRCNSLFGEKFIKFVKYKSNVKLSLSERNCSANSRISQKFDKSCD